MNTCEAMIRALQSGEYNSTLKKLYAPDGAQKALERAAARAIRVAEGFAAQFAPSAKAPLTLFSSPGRTEIGGNHTDHQHGRVLCAAVDLDMLACAAPNGLDVIRICSEGYPELEVSLAQLEPVEEERGTSAALVRGMAAALCRDGCTPCGFDAFVTSDVLSGSGLSSSAAYEILIGTILNRFSGGGWDAVQIAQAGQYAENVYFGKPCGLMDQMACAVGGGVFIDFADPAAPDFRQIPCDLSRFGHALCIVDTGSCHADLTDDYAQIPLEMGAVAACFGKQVLRDVPEEEFLAAIPSLRPRCGDRAVLRAIHFYEDDRRAAEEAHVLEEGDFPRFLELVNRSGHSSAVNLQNIWSVSAPHEQAVSLALAMGRKLLEGAGGIRVHGGGFAGTVQAFVPFEKLESFRQGMEAVFGGGSCHVLRIRPVGGCVIAP